MSLMRCVLTAVFIIFVSACGAYQYPGFLVSPATFSLGTASRAGGADFAPRPLDLGEFQSPGGSMIVERENNEVMELTLSMEIFQPLPGNFIIGVSGAWLMLASGGKDTVFSQALARSQLHWWNSVLYEEVDLERTPMVGGYFGKMFGGKRGEGGLLIQYGIWVGRYFIRDHRYSGVSTGDASTGNETGYSVLANTIDLGSGAAIRQTIEIGFGEGFRLGFWWESDGHLTQTGGLRIIVGFPMHVLEPDPDCGDWHDVVKHLDDSERERQRYEKFCGEQ